MVAAAFGNEDNAHYHEEREREHLHGGVTGDEIADGFCRYHHEGDRGDDGGNHYRQVADHADGGDDGIEREDQIDDDNLGNHRAKAGRAARFFLRLFAGDEVVNFAGAFPDQKHAAGNEDEVAHAEVVPKEAE